MPFPAFDENEASRAKLVTLAVDKRLAVSGDDEEPLVRTAMPVAGIAFRAARLENHLRRLGSAVAGDYAESPAEPQLLSNQLPVNYLEVPLPVPPGAEPELPPPMPPPALPPIVPVLEPPPVPAPMLGEDGLVAPWPVVLPVLLPLAPEPAEERLSRRQSSRCVPVRPTHLLGTSLVAPVAAEPAVPAGEPDWPPVWPTEGRSLAPVVLDPPLVLEPDAPAPAPVEPLAPLAPEPDDAPELPELEPPDWLNATDDNARSAAAVAAVSVFNIIGSISSKI